MQFLSSYGYSGLFVCFLAGQLGLPLLAAGALARAGKLNLAIALLLAVASLIGDTVWYYLGKMRGMGVLRLLCKISLEPDACVRQTNATDGKHSTCWLLCAKFLPGAGTVAPMKQTPAPAGFRTMSPRKHPGSTPTAGRNQRSY